MSTKRHKAQKNSARRASGAFESTNELSSLSVDELVVIVKNLIIKGKSVSATDFDPQDRPAFLAAVAIVQDEIPALRAGWRTLGESHVDGVRFRQRIYRLRGGL